MKVYKIRTIKTDVSASKNAGGIIGLLERQSNQFSNSYARCAVQGTVTAGENGGGIIGSIGDGVGKIELDTLSVNADVYGSGSRGGVGGLVGSINATTSFELYISNTYSVGDITRAKGLASIGYLVGGVSSGVELQKIEYNYHYGRTDKEASTGIGTYSSSNWADALSTPSAINHNIRNAVSGLSSDGDLRYQADNDLQLIVNDNGDSYYNGVVKGAQMKTRLFAGIFNRANNNTKWPPLWSFSKSDNGGLPFFADAENQPAYAVTFDVSSLPDDNMVSTLWNAVSSGEYAYDNCDGACEGLKLFTDSWGLLDEDEVKFVQSLLGDDAHWVSENSSLENTYSYSDSKTRYSSKAWNKLAFNENAAGSDSAVFSLVNTWTDADFDGIEKDQSGNWVYVKKYEGVMYNSFPMNLFRVGYCLDGYTFEPNDKSYGIYTEWTTEFEEVLNTLKTASKMTLYAYWSRCKNESHLLTSADAEDGTLYITRRHAVWKDGERELYETREYEVGKDGLRVPVDFYYDGIKYEFAKSNVVLSDAKYFYGRNPNSANSKWDNDYIGNVGYADYASNMQEDMEIKVLFKVAFDANAANAFYSENWIGYAEFEINDVIGFDALPSLEIVGRADACFAGWGVLDGNNIVQAKNLMSELADDKDIYLYALWDESCRPETFKISSAMEPGKGRWHIYQDINNMNDKDAVDKSLTFSVGNSFDIYDSILEVPSNVHNLSFYIDYYPNDMDSISSVIYVMDVNGNVLDSLSPGGLLSVTGNVILKAKLEENVSYGHKFVFNVDVPEETNVFYGYGWKRTKRIDWNHSNTSLPMGVYRTDATLVGWTYRNPKQVYTEISSDLIDEYWFYVDSLVQAWEDKWGSVYTDPNEYWEKMDEYRQTLEFMDIELHAVWKKDSVKTYTVSSENTDVMLTLSQNIGDTVVSFRVPAEGLVIPAVGEGIPFKVSFGAGDSPIPAAGIVKVLNESGHEIGMLENGGEWYVTQSVTFAFEGSSEKMQIVSASILRSGIYTLFQFESNLFSESRGVKASVDVFDSLGVPVLDTILGNGVNSPYKGVLQFRLPKQGKYKVVAALADEWETAEYIDSFYVDFGFTSNVYETWKMVSLAAFDTASMKWDEDPLFYWWDDANYGEYWQYKQFRRGDSIESMRGYWYSSLEGRSIPLLEDFSDEADDIVWKLDSVKTGWNMVSNPYPWNVDLLSGHMNAHGEYDAESEVLFWKYNPKTCGYNVTTTLGPFEAVWVKTSRPMEWFVSSEPVFLIDSEDSLSHDDEWLDFEEDWEDYEEERKIHEHEKLDVQRALAKVVSKDRWSLQATLADERGRRDEWNIFGVGGRPSVADEPPESMGDHVNLSIVDGKRALAKSIKASSEEMEWTFDLSASSDRAGELTIAGINGVRSLGYHVYVTVDGKTVEMEEGKPLPVYLKAQGATATVKVSSAVNVALEKALKGLRSTRFGNRLQVNFVASQDLVGTNARVDLLDMQGHLVSRVSAPTVLGENALVLDAPRAGLYVLRVRAGSAVQTGKIIVH